MTDADVEQLVRLAEHAGWATTSLVLPVAHRLPAPQQRTLQGEPVGDDLGPQAGS
jgi:hypothetical protein